MLSIDAGDLVCPRQGHIRMLVIGRADEPDGSELPSVFCVWENAHRLHEKVFLIRDLILVRKERRRIPRYATLDFPSY